MELTDNGRYSKSKFLKNYAQLAKQLLDHTLKDLVTAEDLLIFPMDLSQSSDLSKSAKIIESINNQVQFHNIVGFIGNDKKNMIIRSRFSENNSDYFFRYLLQRVLNINVVNLETGMSSEEFFYQLLVYVFPKYLNSAMRKGIYKEYQKHEYNNSNVKGTLDTARHIRNNVPFRGNIAYTTREYTFDNSITQLIRHTIEFIKSSEFNNQNILQNSGVTQKNVAMIIEATPSYRYSDREKVLLRNKRRVLRHAYYTEYQLLKKLCLMILTVQKRGIDSGHEKIKGILFDISWLWEEYVNLILPSGFTHTENRNNNGGVKIYKRNYLISKKSKKHRNISIYPDFYNETTIIDTKYKKLESSINRADLYQIISYMHILNSERAGVFYPTKNKSNLDKIGDLKGLGGTIFKYGMYIPQNTTSFEDFTDKMKYSEREVLDKLLVEFSERG